MDETHADIPQSDEDLSEMLRLRREKLLEMQAAGSDPFLSVSYPVDTRSTSVHENFEAMEGSVRAVAGRMMSRRIMGKACFCDIQDRDGRIQVYVKKDEVGDEAYEGFKRCDIGDILGVRGVVFRTQKGEVSIKAQEAVLLSKSLRTLPEKWHGLRDQETRYRQRYLDLIMNPEIKNLFVKRSAIIAGVRRFLDNRDFLEVSTPVLQTNASGGHARPFRTRHNVLDMDMYLRIALELPLKMLIIGGMERVYEIGYCFRNEGMDIKHNPEFTMLELYQAYTDYEGMMELIESMIKEIALSVNGSLTVNYGGEEVDLSKPFARMTMAEAVRMYSGVDFNKIPSDEEARAAARDRGIEYGRRGSRGEILEIFFDEYAEKKLVQPTFITDHPVEISPLTKKNPDNPGHTQRFELFITGREFANAYSELNDPIDQRQRFEYQERQRAAGDMEANMVDEDFIHAMEYGLPPTGGLGMGVERLVMLLTDSYSIRDVMLFPTMKKLN